MTLDLERALSRLLLLLARSDGRLEPADARGAMVVRCDDGTALKRLRLSPQLQDAVHGRGLATSESDTMRLTAAGRAAAARLSQHPQAWRLQHGAVTTAPAAVSDGATGALIDEAESPLAWLHRRKGPGGKPLLEDAEFTAGERLRLDFTKAGLMPSVTSNWRDMASRSGGGRGGLADLTDAAIAARNRVTGALAALDPGLAGIALDVCCFLKGLETVESDRNWPQRSAKVVLQMALQALARHYGFAAEATGPAGRRLHHWGTADYRPAVRGDRGD